MMCQRIGLPPISIIGLGRRCDSSLMRVPMPPARITAFMRTPWCRGPASPAGKINLDGGRHAQQRCLEGGAIGLGQGGLPWRRGQRCGRWAERIAQAGVLGPRGKSPNRAGSRREFAGRFRHGGLSSLVGSSEKRAKRRRNFRHER